jgi:signal recognition particle receptor subunit beta
MSFINDKTKEINCKVIYYGPALSGKSTAMRFLYERIKKGSKGESISMSKADDGTLYFDFVPLNLGKIGDYTVRLHLYKIPGEMAYEQSRALISKGVDGVVFVADSQLARMDQNLESIEGLKRLLAEDGHEWNDVPCVFMYNKRDLPGTVPADELTRYLNKEGQPDFDSIATSGRGVVDAFKAISAHVLKDLKKEAL